MKNEELNREKRTIYLIILLIVTIILFSIFNFIMKVSNSIPLFVRDVYTGASIITISILIAAILRARNNKNEDNCKVARPTMVKIQENSKLNIVLIFVFIIGFALGLLTNFIV